MENEARVKVDNLMDTARYEAVSVFDRMVIVAAELETGEFMVKAHVSETPESFDTDKGVEACLTEMRDVLMERETISPIALTKEQAEIIVLLADNSMVQRRVAEQMHYTPTSISKKIERIKKNTGIDPMDFFGLCRLLVVAREILAQNP